ncbi:MAG: trigger factor [Deltaproteobacteria bacterium]|nr:trigger factor [Deltaproteobacteria bacterium]
MEISVKVNAEELSPTKKRLEVEIPPPQVKETVESLYRNLNKRVRIKGFRPGKTPRDVLERHYGDYIKEQAISNLINETYPKAISQESIEPIAPPTIDSGALNLEGPFTYSVVVEVRPHIAVTGYTGLRLEGFKGKVAAKKVTAELERLRMMYAPVKQVEGRDLAQKGDVVLIDFHGLLGTRAIRDGKAENYLLEIGSGTMVPGFEEGLIGKKIGGQEELRVSFPADHPRKDLAGKEVTFQVTIKEIRQRVLPSLDDEFAKDVGDYKNLKELKEKITEDLQKANEHKLKEELSHAAISQLLQANPVEIPSYLVQRRTDELLQDLRMRMPPQQQNFPPEEEQKMREEYQKIAEREVRASFLLEGIGQQESIEVTTDEVTGRLQEMARVYQRPLEDLQQNSSLVAVVRRGLQREKVLDFIIAEAEVKYKG